MDGGTVAQKLTPIGSLLSGSWKDYVRRLSELVWIPIPPAILMATGSYLSVFGGVVGALGGVVSAAGGVVSILSTIALIYAVRNEKQVAESYRYAANNLFAYLWIVVLNFLLTVGGIFLGIIPALVFGIWFALAGYVFVAEGDRGLSALLKSKEYIRGYFWPMVGRMLVVVILGMAIAFITATIGDAAGNTGAVALNAILQILFAPFLVVYMYAIYRSFSQLKPELVGTKVVKNRAFFTFAGVWGAAAPILLTLILLATIGAAALFRAFGYY